MALALVVRCVALAAAPRAGCHSRLTPCPRCQGARQGFALAFTGALSVLPTLDTKAAIEMLHKYSEPVSGSLKVSVGVSAAQEVAALTRRTAADRAPRRGKST